MTDANQIFCSVHFTIHTDIKGFPGAPVVKNLPANAGDVSSIPGSGRSPGVRNGIPLQYSCLENSMDWGAWLVTVHGVTESQTRLSTHKDKYLITIFYPWNRIICQLYLNKTKVWVGGFNSWILFTTKPPPRKNPGITQPSSCVKRTYSFRPLKYTW